MLRAVMIAGFMLWLSPGLTQAAIQEAGCFGEPITDAADWSPGSDAIHQGRYRILSWDISPPVSGFPEAQFWLDQKEQRVAGVDYFRWGKCIYEYGGNDPDRELCGDASIDTQLCWSEAPFTRANTNNGETCVSTIPKTGILPARDQTIYAISIDRSGAETTYCQIEFKTLAAGEEVPSAPPGTGSTRVVSLTEYLAPIATPFMPHLLLVTLTALLASIGVRRVRRVRRGKMV